MAEKAALVSGDEILLDLSKKTNESFETESKNVEKDLSSQTIPLDLSKKTNESFETEMKKSQNDGNLSHLRR